MKFLIPAILFAALTARAENIDRILDRSSQAAERQAVFLASMVCTEALVETKLGTKNNPESKSHRLFDYFVFVDTADGDLSVNESRIEQGKVSKTGKQLLQSTGFALLDLIFHPFFSQSFTMSDGGLAASDGQQWRKVLFQFRPGKRSPTLLRSGAREYGISWSGEAWVDEASGRVGRIRAQVAAQLEEIGIKSMEADVRYGPVPSLNDLDGWAPLEAVVDIQTPHQHWRNTHTFSRFRRFDVTSEEKGAKSK